VFRLKGNVIHKNPKSDTVFQLSCRIQINDSDYLLEELSSQHNLKAAVEEKPDHSKFLIIYSKNKSEALKVKSLLLELNKHSFSNFRMISLPQSHWATRWKKGLKVLRISRNLVVSPSWIKYQKKAQEKVIRIDPEMAFGTGHHATTRMCLEWLEKLAPSSKSVCDVGCGSGILAISAAKLGIKNVLALDIDPEAIKIARKNARLNGVLPKIRFLTGPLKEQKIKKHYDIILANLTAQDLQKNWKELKTLANPQKTLLILAGIEKSQQVWFEPWLEKERKWIIIDRKKESDWIGYMLKREKLET